MLFFRSEEQVRAWCAAKGYPVRPLVTMTQLWGLATAWYSTRLQPDARRPQPAEIREIFARLGLGGPFGAGPDANFWDPQSDTFAAR